MGLVRRVRSNRDRVRDQEAFGPFEGNVMTMEQQRVSQGGPQVIVVGVSLGGLTAAMLLAARGFRVTVFEKGDRVGGRNAALVRNGYKFDIGPSFLMMRFIPDEVFQEAGRRAEDYLKFVRLEPMYVPASIP